MLRHSNWLLTSCFILLVGCNGLDRLISGKEAPRNNEYEVSYPDQPVIIQEPYALLQGVSGANERLFLIRWTGNVLDNKGMTEHDVDALGIPKYRGTYRLQ